MDSNPKINSVQKPNICQRFLGILKLITIEPTVFFYAVGFSITMVVTPSLYMEKICMVNFKTLLFQIIV